MHKILIANRGEIAVRVIRTARAMGLKTVAVYSDADAHALFVEQADEAYHIGPAPARDSYLKADTILDIAKRCGADALHPGYGFLSENADFADACAKAGITFIGPPSNAIRAMGLKDKAKALMTDADVPVVPGYHGDDQSADLLAKEADRIGYPVLIKAVAGGGGKGMRRVDSADAFKDALEGAKREGEASFGDARVLVEKYLLKPRHIEIQVFADGHGNAVYLFERDCSLQRRHQKVVEEAPAPDMTQDLRQAMGEAAVKAALAIGYQGAGTVEFIVDVADGLDNAPFYFMEMNTRLQVEHPVTEAITGTDLVEWQIRVARGEPLPQRQNALQINGHAVEVRLYAEDPDNDFLPAIGRLALLKLAEGPGVRIDTGVRTGDEISIHYDPMIAKIIAHGPSRDAALTRLSDALDRSAVLGLTTNKAFLARTLRHAAFIKGDVDTAFIPRHLDDLLPSKAVIPNSLYALAALARLLERDRRACHDAAFHRDPTSPWALVDGWRMNLPSRETLRFTHQGNSVQILSDRGNTGFSINYDGDCFHARGTLENTGDLAAFLNGHKVRAHVVFDGESLLITHEGISLHLEKAITHVEDAGDTDALDSVIAPMPGKVLSLNIAEGADVKKGDALVVLEAMKMEHSLSAPRDGRIEELHFAAGDQVKEGDVILTFATKNA